MLQISNKTALKEAFAILPDVDGVDSVHVFVRGVFDLEGHLLPGDFQESPRLEDQYWDKPIETCLKFPSDLTLGKSGTDVLLIGNAYSPTGDPVESMFVRLRVGEVIDKTITIFGDRTWEKSRFIGAVIPSAPKPFETMPLVWERAYGGSDKIDDDDSTMQQDERNPLGVGFIHPKQHRSAVFGRPLPNLENPSARYQDWKKPAVSPAGFGAVCPRWKPRCDYSGTYDETWQKERSPHYPKDLKMRFFNTAPSDQIAPEGLHGNEPVEIVGVQSGKDPLRFTLPSWNFETKLQFSGEQQNVSMRLETVIIQTEEKQLNLIWAAHSPCDKKVLKIKEILVEGGILPFST